MPTLYDWNLTLDLDHVMRGQGANPAVLRARRPHLVDVAQQASHEASILIRPAVAYRQVKVEALRHEKLLLEGGGVLSGPLVARQLGGSLWVALIVCTLGDALDRRVSALLPTDPVYALALDGAGTAAIETLAAAVCQYFDALSARDGLQTTIPISPGMLGWPVDVGQGQVFALLDTDEIDVALTPSFQMIPRKSTSMAIGVGPEVRIDGRPCDFCSMQGACRFQDHYG